MCAKYGALSVKKEYRGMIKMMIKKYLSNCPFLYQLVHRVYSVGMDMKNKIIGAILNFLPLNKKKIVICNYYGKGYGDNAKYIVEEIIRQNIDYDVVWLLDKKLMGKRKFPRGVRAVKYGSLKGLYEMATAKVWIDNCRKVFYPPKRNKQFYIQTWHGGIALKRIEMDVQDKLSPIYVRFAKKDSQIADLFISNSKFCTEMYRRAFLYEGEILECGSPRVDILFKGGDAIVEKVRDLFGIEDEARILLYAPTFRKDFGVDCYDIDFASLLNVLEDRYGSKWYVFLRLHPNIPSDIKLANSCHIKRIIDVSCYDDLYELFLACDILITDYSSVMFEFSLLQRPVFLYASDVELYKQDRDFYFDIKALPYPLSENNQELFDNIRTFDEGDYLKKLSKFMKQLDIYESGVASEKVVEKIKSVIEN
jgi:CDP-glycerol glycerophosphotransferase